MIRRSLTSLLIGLALVAVGQAQIPVPGEKGETKTFSMFFDGDGSYLGVQTEEITKENFSKYGLREVRGVAVEKVVEGSPAEKAGLQNGDVIVSFNGEEVTSTRKLTRLLSEVAPDHQARITVVRGGSERQLTATVGKRQMPKFDEGSFSMNVPRVPNAPFPPSAEWPGVPRVEVVPPGAPDQPFVWRMGSGRRIGIGVTTLTKQLSEHFGVAGGVMINEVRSDSPAAKAGLKAGDIIVEADGKAVKGEIDLIRAIQEKKEGNVTLIVVRNRDRHTIQVTPEEAKDDANSFWVIPNSEEPSKRARTPGLFDTPTVRRSLFPLLNFPGPVL